MRGSWAVLVGVAVLAAFGNAAALAEDAGTDIDKGVDMGPESAGELMPVMVHLGALLIEDPWTRATPPGAPTAAAYVTITNNGSEPDRLIGATAGIADEVDLHEMTMQGDVMQMRPVPGGIDIAPGEKVSLMPGGYHLMLIGLGGTIGFGDDVPITLEFERAGTVSLMFHATVAGGGSPYSMGMGGSHAPDTMDDMDGMDGM
jgi:copper(I)-binding protein